METGYKENYTEMIHIHPISAQPKDKSTPGGPFDRAVEKSDKAIKLHSIKTKPPKKPGWRNDSKQVALQTQEEYNPFLKNCWMMLGKAQFYNADFLQASATFSYITRHYAQDEEMVTAARLWQARCYSELEWFYEAGDILKKLNTNGIPKKNLHLYAAVNAGYLIKEQRFEEAVPYLQTAIKAEKNKLQRTRMKYLLGQIYAGLEQNQPAYDMFRNVAASNPPYELEFAARIRQTEVFSGANYRKIVKMLERMAGSDKNKELLDQVYYAIGNVYLNRKDTANAVANYELAVEKSVRNGLDKAIAQIKVGDIYFQVRDYIKAQPHFSGALAGITKEYKDYERVSHLSSVLDELVIHAEAVHLQDSLQTLARMPEEERLAAIDKIIEQVIKEEKEAKESAEKEAYLAKQEAQGTGINRPGTEAAAATLPATGDGSFYFYNPQAVAQGKTQFQRRWGRRPLEDDWRRANKTFSTFEEGGEQSAAATDPAGQQLAGADTTLLAGAESDSAGVSDDPKTREYYIQQLPLTPEDIEASNIIIADGLFHIAMIYKDKLEDLPLAIEAFEDLERRFPENEYRLESYYQIFLMALRLGDTGLANTYKEKLTAAYPGSDYATAIADPDYERNMRMMDVVQDSIYEATYNSYLAGEVQTVRRNYRDVSARYPLAGLIPKFMFLDALTYVEEGDAEGFKAALKTLLDKYPEADVSELAGEMLKGVLRGRALVQGSVRGMTWNMRFGAGEDGTVSDDDLARTFTAEKNAPYRMMLVFPSGSIDRNQLLFAVAAYNFAHFMVKELDLTLEETVPVGMLMVTGFYNFDEILRYYRMIYSPEGYAGALHGDVSVIPISEDNYQTLMRGKTLEEYVTFFEEAYGEEVAGMAARWHIRMDEDEQSAGEEEEEKAKEEQQPAREEQQPVQEEKPPVREERQPAVEEPQPGEEEPIETPADTAAAAAAADTVPAVQGPVEDAPLTLKEIEELRKREAADKTAREALEADERAAKQKQAVADRKAKEEAQKQLRKQKERDAKQRMKQREKELKAKAKARRDALKAKEAAARKK
jgi:tetratricopeptide (TPR) repeat protein